MKTNTTAHSLKEHLAQWQLLNLILIPEREFQKALGIHRNTSFRFRKKGLIPYLQIGRKVHYRLTDVLLFVHSGRSGYRSTNS